MMAKGFSGETAPAADESREREIERLVGSLHARRGQDLYGLAIGLGLSHEDASDAVQEGMLRLWRQLRDGAELHDLDAWAFRATYNVAMDHHRLGSRIAAMVGRLTDDRRHAPDPADSSEQAVLWEAVDRLPKRQRAVLYLRYRADLPFEQIGLVLGITANAARSHSSFALATLRRRLEREDS